MLEMAERPHALLDLLYLVISLMLFGYVLRVRNCAGQYIYQVSTPASRGGAAVEAEPG